MAVLRAPGRTCELRYYHLKYTYNFNRRKLLRLCATMKILILVCLAVFLFHLCHAQCDLNVSDQQLVNALSEADLISEIDPTKFNLQDLTPLCFVRSSTDNTRFDQVRVSILYTYDSATVLSAQATFTLCLSGSFRFKSAYTYTVTQDPHLTENVTREDCKDCLDNSTFARPTFCRREYNTRMGRGRGIEVACSLLALVQTYSSLFSPVDDPCDAAPCANGGTCSRTGLTDFSCTCDGNWDGATCESK